MYRLPKHTNIQNEIEYKNNEVQKLNYENRKEKNLQSIQFFLVKTIK